MLHCVPGEQSSRPGPSMFLFFFSVSFLSFFLFHGSVTETSVAHNQFIAPSPIKGPWRNNFSGHGTIILKAVFLCINSARNSLLIHGFWPVNARLLIAYGTAFLCNYKDK